MDPQVFISRIVKLGSDFRYPSNIGNIEDGLHHFMVIKELQYKEENKRDDPINGQTRFENLIGSRNDASFFYREEVLHFVFTTRWFDITIFGKL